MIERKLFGLIESIKQCSDLYIIHEPLPLYRTTSVFRPRLSNNPDLIRILLILLENPESLPICDQDRKNPDFDICFDIFKYIVRITQRTPNRVYFKLKLIPCKLKYTT